MTVNTAGIYRRRTIRLQRKKITFTFATFLLILSLFFGYFTISSEAQDNDSRQVLYKYYTSIEVQYGESLWNIAETYFCNERYRDYNEYIAEIMYLNKLYDENIKAGSYLIIPYYSPEFK